MDKLINSHIDKLDELEEAFGKKIDAAVAAINIDEVLKDPETEMRATAEIIKAMFLNDIAPQAIELGISFAGQIKTRIEKDKDIKIQDSNNPKLNADG